MALPEDNQTPQDSPASSPYPESPEPAYSAPGDDYADPSDPSYAPGSQQAGQADPEPEAKGSSRRPFSPPKADEEEADPDEDGMLRMSFLEHLEELRTRLIRILIGMAVAFIASLTFSKPLWDFISGPALAALTELKRQPKLITLEATDLLTIVWWKMPFVCSIFLASPWVLYQIWAFIAPGLYKRERRFAGPFIVASVLLFLLGGLFAYFVAFRFGLVFLLGFGETLGLTGVEQQLTVTSYFDLFVNVILGVSVIFELPMVIFLLILLRITSSRFLITNARYAILLIVVLAAVITPTPDVFNLALFSVPMILLYFVGIFAGYLVELDRNNQKFPWIKILSALLVVFLCALAVVVALVAGFNYKLVNYWPFLVK